MEGVISLYQVIAFMVALITIIGGLVGINRQIKAQMDGYATKEYVDNKDKVLEEKINAIERENNDTKADIKYIRSRIDVLIDAHIKEGE